jgi:Fe-S oxidoreductase
MTWGGALLLVLIIAAHAVFLRRLYNIFRWIELGQGTLPWGDLPRRFADLAIKGFGQSLVIRTPSGWFHAIIFWGFFVLTVGTLEGLIEGVFPGFSLAFLGPVYWLVNTLMEVFAVLVLVALAASLYRRFVIRPKRLEGPRAHKIDALIIIGLIGSLILAYFGLSIVSPRAGFTPVADALRALFLGDAAVGKEAMPVAHAFFLWAHNLIVLGFLAYIPYSKHLHIITALPNLFFREERIRGRIPRLNLEDEKAESFGIVKITDYSRKELLDVASCTECGRCQEACPAYNTGKALSPKKVVLDLKEHLFTEGPRLVKDPAAEALRKLYPEVIAPEVLWACTTCFACEEVCPVEIRPMSKLLGIRHAAVLMEGDFPEEAQNTLRNIENQGNPWGLPQEERGAWAEGHNVPTLAEQPDVEYLFFAGCAGAYDQRYVRVAQALTKLLQHAGVRFGILGNEEICTGDPAKRIGNDYLAQAMAQQNVDTMNAYGVKKVITSCPHCFNAIKNEFPQYGGEFEVMHHTQLIADLLRQGRIKPNLDAPKTDIAYHDSCYLARYNGIEDAPRESLAGAGAVLREMPRHEEHGFCCGAGGGRMWMDEREGTPINAERAREAIATGAGTVATACPFCMTMLNDGVARHGKAEEVRVKDVAEILAELV